MSAENEFFLPYLLSFPTATVVVAHSPTPSAVNIIDSVKGDEKHLLHGLNDGQKKIF